MTTHEFDALASGPRHGNAVAKRSRAPVESLAARMRRLRIARGYSIFELATEARIFAGTIQRIESGRPVHKRVLAPLAAALGVRLCRLVCGEHNCAERACVPQSCCESGSEPPRCGSMRFGAFRGLKCTSRLSRGGSSREPGRRYFAAAVADWTARPAASVAFLLATVKRPASCEA
jgi:Helix-turn-helix domain